MSNIKQVSHSAFTLVELIVVIVILAILSTIAFLSFSSQSSSARDSSKLADVSNLSKGLELYQVNSGIYPMPENISGTGIINGEVLSYVGTIQDKISRLLKINKTPVDPLSSSNYMYGVSYNQIFYQIGAVLENPVAFNNINNNQSINDFDYSNLLIPTIYSATANTYQSKVSGNYKGIIKKQVGTNMNIYNVPSLLFTGSGNLVSTGLGGTFFVADKSTNLPYKIDSTTPDNSISPDKILALVGNTATTVTGVIVTESNYNTLTGILGYNEETIGIATFGITKYFNEIKTNTDITVITPESCTELTEPGYFTYDSVTKTITAFDTTNSPVVNDIIFPCKIGSNDILHIGNDIFSRYGDLTSVTIPSSVMSIGDYSFEGNQLTSLTIPSSVTSIGDGAFGGNQLTSVTLPNSITNIGDRAFSQNLLTSVTIPSSVTNIGDATFSNNLLTSVTIPSSVTSIGSSAFGSNKLTSVTIPSSVTSIGSSAFSNNLLTNMTIPSGVMSIGDRVFESNQLSSVTIPSNITSIGDYAFYGNQLTSATIPSSVTNIGAGAFRNNQLTSATIPSSVTNIKDYTFYDNQLTSVTIPSGVTNIGQQSFYNNKLTSVTIPSSITYIGAGAFQNNGPDKNSGIFSDRAGGGTWNLVGTTWVKQ
ncbi:MAG: leucine-rich repeat protein [Candidatus Gracilibacteria bacterium]|nr:leucine-rich repeat protein [Candidatus Gracilibacteria bacterium]MDD2908137.1 leucine-rich repeat protein [Candidatus Gracilibacteria bacterium]